MGTVEAGDQVRCNRRIEDLGIYEVSTCLQTMVHRGISMPDFASGKSNNVAYEIDIKDGNVTVSLIVDGKREEYAWRCRR